MVAFLELVFLVLSRLQPIQFPVLK